MKTNKTITFNSLTKVFDNFREVDRLTSELYLVIVNTKYLHDYLVKNRQIKCSAIAFNALYELIKNFGIANSRIISNEHMKEFLLKFYNLNYKEVLKDLVLKLEDYRNERKVVL